MVSSAKTSSEVLKPRLRKSGKEQRDEEKFMQQYGHLCKDKMTQHVIFLIKIAII
jgi:hypothetical protein